MTVKAKPYILADAPQPFSSAPVDRQRLIATVEALTEAQTALTDMRRNTEAAESEHVEQDKHCARVDTEVVALRTSLAKAEQKLEIFLHENARLATERNDARAERDGARLGRDLAEKKILHVHDALHRECDGTADLPAEIRALRAFATKAEARAEEYAAQAQRHEATRLAGEELAQALGEMEYPKEPGTFCDHAAAPCHRCDDATAALDAWKKAKG